MVKREDIEKQIGFLEKDTMSVKDRFHAVSAEEEQLTATLSSLNCAIQVSKHYLGMFKEVESEVNTTTEDSKKKSLEELKKDVEKLDEF